jgi:DNA-binding NarL/FixJ family response regulator
VTTSLLDRVEIELLQEMARGLKNRHIEVKWDIEGPELARIISRMYLKLGVHSKGQQSRAYALAVATKKHGVPLPEELLGPAEAFREHRVEFEDDLDHSIMLLISEAHSIPEIIKLLQLHPELIRRRIAAMQLRTGLVTYPVFCVATAAIHAGLLPELDVEREYQLTAGDIQTLVDVVEEISIEGAAAAAGISPIAMKARRQMLRVRLQANSVVNAVEVAISQRWLTLGNFSSARVLQAVALVQAQKLSVKELAAVDLLAKGFSRAEIGRRMAGELKGGPNYLLNNLYRRFKVSDSAALVAVVRFADNPLSEEPAPAAESAPLFERWQIQLLELLAAGLTQEEIAQRGRTGKKSIAEELGRIYAVLGALNAANAVAIAADRDLLAGFLTDDVTGRVPDGIFGPDYIGYLEQTARGARTFDILTVLGIPSRTELLKRIAPDRDLLDVPLHTQIAVLIRRGTIKLDRPTIPAVAPMQSPEAETAVAVEVPAARATEDEDPLLVQVLSLIQSNQLDPRVQAAQRALSADLGRFVSEHFAECVVAISSGRLPRPIWDDKLTALSLKPQYIRFLRMLIGGKTLKQIRQASDFASRPEQAFQMWYSGQVCTALGARDPFEAAVIALWSDLVKM